MASSRRRLSASAGSTLAISASDWPSSWGLGFSLNQAISAAGSCLAQDEIALDETSRRLRMRLGDEEYEAALNDGAALDGDAAVEHASRSL